MALESLVLGGLCFILLLGNESVDRLLVAQPEIEARSLLEARGAFEPALN